MTLIKPYSKDLSIVFVEIGFFLRLVPLSELGGGSVGAGAANGGFEAIGLGLRIGVDVGLKSVEEEDWDSEEG